MDQLWTEHVETTLSPDKLGGRRTLPVHTHTHGFIFQTAIKFDGSMHHMKVNTAICIKSVFASLLKLYEYTRYDVVHVDPRQTLRVANNDALTPAFLQSA